MYRFFAAVLGLGLLASPAAVAQEIFYVGTYNGSTSKGIYVFEFDPKSGTITNRGVAGEERNPSFLAVAPNKQFLYAASEIGMFEEKKTGAVSAFQIDPKTKTLTLLNKQPSGGGGACHVSTDPAGKFVFVANYNAGTVSMLPVKNDGGLAAPINTQQHQGSSVNKARQNEPHAHSINVDPTGKFAIAADLGTDMLYVYRIDATNGLTPHEPPGTKTKPGAGPRHLAFHPNGKTAFVINELNLTMSAFEFDSDKGTLTHLHSAPLLPKGAPAKGLVTAAEVSVHPSGKWVLGSVRGADSIAVLAYDEGSKKLALKSNATETVKTPRNFTIDPSGEFVIVANQKGNSLTVFRMNQETGELTRVGEPTPCPNPVCVRFLGKGKE